MILRALPDDAGLFERAVHRFRGLPGDVRSFLATPGALAFVAARSGAGAFASASAGGDAGVGGDAGDGGGDAGDGGDAGVGGGAGDAGDGDGDAGVGGGSAGRDEILGWCWGYHLIRPDSTSMLYLHQLDVAEEHRRRGVGRALLTAFMEAGAQAGATRMFLTTGETNTPARALYDAMGGGLATQGPTVNYWFVLD